MSSVREDFRDQIIAIRETIVDGCTDAVQFVRETWPALLILLVCLAVVIFLADPAPPKHVQMATGPKGSANEVLGKKYAEFFAQRGITLELVPTQGSLENVRCLQDHKDPVRAAFVASGSVQPGHTEGLETLGSIDYQPLWFFYRSAKESPLLLSKLWQTGKVNIGAADSGTYVQASKILTMNGITPDAPNFSHQPETEAIEALRQGEIDGLFVIDTYDSPNVQTLLAMPGVQIGNYERADAYARLAPSLAQVSVPEGGLNLGQNKPAHNVNLIAATTEILIDDELHPAIRSLFLMAARAINGPQHFFAREGEFPAFKDTTIPRCPVAQVFYEKGTPALMDYLPFWLAEFVHRMFLLVLPFAAVAYPIIRSMPNYHKNRIRGRINRMYGSLKFFEQTLSTAYDPAQKDSYLKQLDDMERGALGMKVPKSVASDYYTLRSTIAFVRKTLLRDGYLVYRVNDSPEAAS